MIGADNPQTLRAIPVFFIIGMGRSGTTLLKTIFDNHPELICPPESKLILFLRKKYQHKIIVHEDAKKIVDYIRLDRKVQTYWNFDFDLLQKDMEACIAKGGNFFDLCKLIYLHYPPAILKKKIQMIGDKNPGFTMYVSWLNHSFKESKFIHIIRDYRDCIASYNRVFKKSHVGVLAETWLAYAGEVEKMKQLFPDRFITVRYENLTANPEHEIARLCEFLEIQPDPKMFSYNEKLLEQSRKFESTAFNSIHGELLKPIHDKNVGKYKKYLTEKQLQLIEFICSEKGKTYHYEPTLPAKRNPILTLISWYSFLIFKTEIYTIRFYYGAPYFLRSFFRRMSNFLFVRIQYSNKFNNAELMLKKKTK